jgi:hypothetical protein
LPSNSPIDIDLEGIGHLLADKPLFVPPYQRSYAWTEEHVNDLLKDIHGALQDDATEYFLGSIVLMHHDDETLEVVDGQQRLATVSIIISSIRNHLLDTGETQRANSIEQKYLQKIDLRTLEAKPQLRLNLSDHEFYQEEILTKKKIEKTISKNSRESHKRIQNASKISAEFIKKITGLTQNPVHDLLDWLEFLENKARVIRVQVPDDHHAWIIFETLNDRGLALSISDLLKNYLFGLAGDRLNEAQSNWLEMLGTLESVGDEELVLMFLRQVWSSYHGLTRERQLFNQVKIRITSKKTALTFSRELAENAKIYAALLSPQHEFWQPYGDAARSSIDTLLSLGLKQPRSLLLAVLAKFKPAEVKRVLAYIVACSVRFTIVGQLGSSTLENLYAESAKKVRAGEISTPKELKLLLDKDVPNDIQFEEAFSQARVTSAVHARYYLRALELTNSNESEPELVPNTNRDVVTLEHILPQKANISNWPDFSPDLIQAYFNRIGNLTLLKQKSNSNAGNTSFLKKIDTFKTSSFALTKQLANYTTWTTKEIESRQKELAKLAVRCWSLRIT